MQMSFIASSCNPKVMKYTVNAINTDDQTRHKRTLINYSRRSTVKIYLLTISLLGAEDKESKSQFLHGHILEDGLNKFTVTVL